MTVVARIEQPPAAAVLAASIANIRSYLVQHPCADFHLEVVLSSLLAALQVYANAATDETIRAVLSEVIEAEAEDEPLPDARLNS